MEIAIDLITSNTLQNFKKRSTRALDETRHKSRTCSTPANPPKEMRNLMLIFADDSIVYDIGDHSTTTGHLTHKLELLH